MVKFTTDHFENGKLEYRGSYVSSMVTRNNDYKNFDIVAGVEFIMQFGDKCASWNQEHLKVGKVYIREDVGCDSDNNPSRIEITNCFKNEDEKHRFIDLILTLEVDCPLMIEDYLEQEGFDESTKNCIFEKLSKLFEEEN